MKFLTIMTALIGVVWLVIMAAFAIAAFGGNPIGKTGLGLTALSGVVVGILLVKAGREVSEETMGLHD